MEETQSMTEGVKESYGTMQTAQDSTQKSMIVTRFRWIIYFMCSYQTFVQWFILYSPTGLETQFINDYYLTYSDYALLFSIATGPTCIFPLISGIIVDKFGICISAITSISILLIGNILFALSMYLNNPLILMYIARCIIGIGICYYGVTNNAIIHIYFHNAELAFALGIGPIHSRTGLAAGQFVSFAIYKYIQQTMKIGNSQNILIYVVWFTAILCAFSLLFETTILLSQRSYIKEHKQYVTSDSDHIEEPGTIGNSHDDQNIFLKLKEYTLSFWIVIIIAGLGYLPFLGWMVTGTDALMTTYNYDQSKANTLLLIPNLSALIGCFLVGIVIDKFGRIQIYFLLSGTIYFLWHLFFLYGNELFNDNTDESVIIFMLILFGFGFSCFSTSMWTSVAILSGHSKIGMGNGIAFFSYAIFYAVGQYIVGNLTDVSDGISMKYYGVSIFLLCISIAILVCSIMLLIDDCWHKKELWKRKIPKKV